MPHHLGDILAAIPSERLMIGSDLPESAATELGKIFELKISKKSKRDILWNTARRLFDGK